jgi:hypothetical protein
MHPAWKRMLIRFLGRKHVALCGSPVGGKKPVARRVPADEL